MKGPIVRSATFALLALLTVCAITFAQNPVFRARTKPIKAVVRIRAVSSSVRQNFAGSQDTFLAEMTGHNGESQLVKLVDRFPSYEDPIRPALLASEQPFRMRLLREESCDSPEAGMALRSAKVYDPALQTLLGQMRDATLPCFIVEHQATRLIAHGPTMSPRKP